MSPKSAEMTKSRPTPCCPTKISFINEMANLASWPGRHQRGPPRHRSRRRSVSLPLSRVGYAGAVFRRTSARWWSARNTVSSRACWRPSTPSTSAKKACWREDRAHFARLPKGLSPLGLASSRHDDIARRPTGVDDWLLELKATVASTIQRPWQRPRPLRRRLVYCQRRDDACWAPSPGHLHRVKQFVHPTSRDAARDAPSVSSTDGTSTTSANVEAVLPTKHVRRVGARAREERCVRQRGQSIFAETKIGTVLAAGGLADIPPAVMHGFADIGSL